MGGGGCTQANGALKTDVISKNFENLIVVAFKFWLNNLNFFAKFSIFLINFIVGKKV